jgi:hypothetical protein
LRGSTAATLPGSINARPSISTTHGHGIGCVLPSAGSCARAGDILDLLQLCVADLAGSVLADGFEDILHGDVCSV